MCFEIIYYRVIKRLWVCQDYCVRQAANHTICFAYCNPLVIFLPDLQLILGQTHDETENGKLATHIFESFRPCSVIDQYRKTGCHWHRGWLWPKHYFKLSQLYFSIQPDIQFPLWCESIISFVKCCLDISEFVWIDRLSSHNFFCQSCKCDDFSTCANFILHSSRY